MLSQFSLFSISVRNIKRFPTQQTIKSRQKHEHGPILHVAVYPADVEGRSSSGGTSDWRDL